MGGLIDLRQLWGNGLATLVRGEIYKTGTYTPDWTGATTNPVIGNGSLVGTYVAMGPMVDVYIRMAAGASTTFGTGKWVFRLPFPANTSTDAYWLGHATVYDASTSSFTSYGILLEFYDPYISVFYTSSAKLNFHVTSPIAWATNDELYIQIRYRRA